MANRAYRNKEWLHRKYIDELWSQSEIAVYCDVSAGVVGKWLRKLEIPVRTISQANAGRKNGAWLNSPYKDYDMLYKLYITERKTLRDIAEIANVGLRTIARWINDHNIPTRSGKDKLVNHVVTHVPDVNKALRNLTYSWRQEVFERDGHKCRECESPDNLNAHHIVPFLIIRDQLIMEHGDIVDFSFDTEENRVLFVNTVKDDSRLHDVDNGLTLCETCHTSEHRRLKSLKKLMLYVYSAKVIDNYDGDTVTLDVDMGFGLTKREVIRLIGINCPELRGGTDITKLKGLKAKAALSLLCEPGKEIVLQTYKSGKYGRYLGVLLLATADVNEFMLTADLASEYIL